VSTMTGGIPSVILLLAGKPAYQQVLSEEALAFVAGLHRRFNGVRRQLLAAREERQRQLDSGAKPDFLPETKAIREGDWVIAPQPQNLLDRRVEITGPVDRKMIINGLNSGARVFMADFEDSNTPTWTNQIEGQINLAYAVRRSITYEDPASGKKYQLNAKTAVLFVRPREWHLEERRMLVDGEPVSGSLFDFGLFFFHNGRELLARGSGPYFYLPKMESHLEARLWNDVFRYAQDTLSIPRGSIKATVLVETILATFELHEILYELREHSAGLNCGRWDYIFSYIKKFSKDPRAVLPDRAKVTMTTPFLRSYSKLVIQTCHRRNAPAIGGMSAFIPIKNDPVANEIAMAQVRADKEREAGEGHDGTWVAHPGLVPVATEIFDRLMPAPNQITKKLDEVQVTAQDLIEVPKGQITEAGLRQNIAVGLRYLESWFRGVGCVPLFNLMEDAATAEISRAQLWQWVCHGSKLEDGRVVDLVICDEIIDEELGRVENIHVSAERMQSYRIAASLLCSLIRSSEFTEFLTIPAYRQILEQEGIGW
jgi:malate synthase